MQFHKVIWSHSQIFISTRSYDAIVWFSISTRSVWRHSLIYCSIPLSQCDCIVWYYISTKSVWCYSLISHFPPSQCDIIFWYQIFNRSIRRFSLISHFPQGRCDVIVWYQIVHQVNVTSDFDITFSNRLWRTSIISRCYQGIFIKI